MKIHYLPEFYLKQWASPLDGKVTRFYRPYAKVVVSRIKPEYTGFEHDLTAFNGIGDDFRHAIETQFMSPQVDDGAAKALGALLADDAATLSDNLRKAWAKFMISLQYRPPHAVAKTIGRVKSKAMVMKLSGQENSEQCDDRNLHDLVAAIDPNYFDNLGKLLPTKVIDNEKMQNAIQEMYWHTVDLWRSDFSLMTGDVPLIIAGITNPDGIITLPLSPRRLFVAVKNRQLLRRLSNASHTTVASKSNATIVEAAMINVYADSDTQIKYVERRLRLTTCST